MSWPGSVSWRTPRLVTEARKLAYALDPAGFVARQRNAETDRRVTLRPAPDTMAWLGALLPVAPGMAADGVPVKVTLVLSADTLLAGGTAPGHLDGYGPVPTPSAREMALSGQAPAWLRRVFTAPASGTPPNGTPPNGRRRCR